ncbi:ArsC/Spx/MgsR family protein [Tenacibaculum piscium]|uniref:ArsC/Spx/MgsR family protein n=1 Tax=Tenacibaculum piscium TaxID=1458515 RepID=UPI001F430B83|nr:ArsC/Spx/MgsR family protein [Tenacibaculum piscium]
MIKIYHNPRCSKSRQGVEILENSKKELSEIIGLLNINPIELVRKNEKIWKENFKKQFENNELSDTQLIKIMVENPKLIERPIVINKEENKAVIGRPTENILTII